jgi:hypothetical protein
MEDVFSGQMVGDLATTVSLFPFTRRRFVVRRGRGRFIGRGRRCTVVEEMLLPGRFRQPLTARPEEHPLQYEVFFLEARVGTLHFLGSRHELVELSLEIVESHEKGSEQLLAGRQVVRDGVEVLRHNHIYDYDGACVGEFQDIFYARLNSRGRSVCGAPPWSRRCRS